MLIVSDFRIKNGEWGRQLQKTQLVKLALIFQRFSHHQFPDFYY